MADRCCVVLGLITHVSLVDCSWAEVGDWRAKWLAEGMLSPWGTEGADVRAGEEVSSGRRPLPLPVVIARASFFPRDAVLLYTNDLEPKDGYGKLLLAAVETYLQTRQTKTTEVQGRESGDRRSTKSIWA